MPATDELDLLHRAQREVDRRDRKYHFRTYEDCFLGSDLVRWLQEAYQVDEEEAITIGRRWQEENKWLEHVVYGHKLKNKKLFYRWTVHRMVDRNTPACKTPRIKSASFAEGGADQENVWLELSAHDFKRLLRVLQPGVVMQNLTHPETGIKMRPHRSILRTYKNCFCGSDAVSWVEDRLLLERPQAVLLLEKLMVLGYFHPIIRKHAFVDGPPVYTTDGAWESPEKVPSSLVFQRDLMETMHHTFRTRDSLPRNTFSTSTTNLKALSHSECYYNDSFNRSSLPVHIPVLVEFCISRLQEKEMLQTEGVFRLSAPSAAVNRLAIVIGCCSDGGAIVLKALRATPLSHVLAQLLKKFLSELPEGILAQEAQWLYWEIICNGAAPTQETNSKIKLRQGHRSRRISANYQKRMKNQDTILKAQGCGVCATPILFTPSLQESSLQESVRAKVLSLPGCRVAILHRLIVLLDAVRSSPRTKLNDSSLAAIFSPILVRKMSDNIKRYVKQVDTVTDLIVFLINNHEEVFRVLPSGHTPKQKNHVPCGRVESIRPACLVRSLSFSLECHQHDEQKKVIIESTLGPRLSCLRSQTESGGGVL